MRLTLLVLISASAAAAQTGATYEVTLKATWAETTHPDGFPSNPHFSPLIGAAHGPEVILWEAGTASTLGIESMAETGATATLEAEVEAHAAAGRAARVISGDWLPVSPGTVTTTVMLDAAAPLVSLVTMLAPSPDWFVGVFALDLREGAGWDDERVLDLYVYDAGSDDGATYTADDADSDPKQPIARIEAAPFEVGGTVEPVGTFTFRLIGVTSAPEDPEAAPALQVVPNPVTGGTVRLRLGGPARTARVRVVDVRGREVYAASVGVAAGGADLQVPVAGWAPGVYGVIAEDETGVSRARITVLR